MSSTRFLAWLVLILQYAGAAGDCSGFSYPDPCDEHSCYTGSDCILCSSFETQETCPTNYCTWTGSQCGGQAAEFEACSTFSTSSACPTPRCSWSGEQCDAVYKDYPNHLCGQSKQYVSTWPWPVPSAAECLSLCEGEPGCVAVEWWPHVEQTCYRCLEPSERFVWEGWDWAGPPHLFVLASVSQETITRTITTRTTATTTTTTLPGFEMCSKYTRSACQAPRCHWNDLGRGSCETAFFDHPFMTCVGERMFLGMSVSAEECLALCPGCPAVEWWEKQERFCSKCMDPGMTWYDGPVDSGAAPPHVYLSESMGAFESTYGKDQACRGSNPEDNSRYYFTVESAEDLESCKALCANMGGICKGIELSRGRCELWTRPEGIGSTKPLLGFTCLRYRPAPVFEPVDGGQDRVCRGSSPSDNEAKYFMVVQAANIADCQAQCMEQRSFRATSTGSQPGRCIGIEYSLHRCELWVRPEGIQASLKLPGSMCMRLQYHDVTEPSSTTSWVFP